MNWVENKVWQNAFPVSTQGTNGRFTLIVRCGKELAIGSNSECLSKRQSKKSANCTSNEQMCVSAHHTFVQGGKVLPK